MANLNQLQMLMSLKKANPRQIAQQIINENFKNDPKMQQLLQMAANNDYQGVNKFAQQFFSERGMDFNKEMTNLMSTLRNL